MVMQLLERAKMVLVRQRRKQVEVSEKFDEN